MSPLVHSRQHVLQALHSSRTRKANVRVRGPAFESWHSHRLTLGFLSLGLSFPICKNKNIELTSLVLPALTSLTAQPTSSSFLPPTLSFDLLLGSNHVFSCRCSCKMQDRIGSCHQLLALFCFVFIPRKVVFSEASLRSSKSCISSCLSPST